MGNTYQLPSQTAPIGVNRTITWALNHVGR